MKEISQKYGAMTLALLVLFSTLSFTVIKHYCGDMLMSQTVFQEVDACCAAMDHSSDSELPAQNDCCSTQQFCVQSQESISATFPNLNFSQQVFVASFFYSYLNLFEGLAEQITPFKNYSPPLIVQDVQVLNETFLI